MSAFQSIAQRLSRLAYGDDAARWNTPRDAWGRTGTLEPPWRAGAPRIVTSIDPPPIWRVPQVLTLLLRAQIVRDDPNIFQSGVVRWVVEAGVGSARESYTFDAAALQQITVPGESIRVSLLAEQWGQTEFSFGFTKVNFGVLIGDGASTTSAAQFSHYIEAVEPPGATQTDVPIPNGATAFRVAGSPHNSAPSNPFVADKNYGFRQAGGTFIDSFNGPDMLGVHASGDFVPFAGTPDLLRVTHPPGDMTGVIVFRLEL